MHLHATNWFTNLQGGRGEALTTDVFTQVIIIRHMGGTTSSFCKWVWFHIKCCSTHKLDLYSEEMLDWLPGHCYGVAKVLHCTVGKVYFIRNFSCWVKLAVNLYTFGIHELLDAHCSCGHKNWAARGQCLQTSADAPDDERLLLCGCNNLCCCNHTACGFLSVAFRVFLCGF